MDPEELQYATQHVMEQIALPARASLAKDGVDSYAIIFFCVVPHDKEQVHVSMGDFSSDDLTGFRRNLLTTVRDTINKVLDRHQEERWKPLSSRTIGES